MSKRQLSKIFPGVTYKNSKQNRWFEALLKRDKRCLGCGTKINLQPHHIIPCHIYDELYFDIDNGAILCKSCHERYHRTCIPANRETFDDFCSINQPTPKGKKKIRYSRKKYEPSPLYSKIKVNDFTKEKPKKKKKSKNRRRKRKRKVRFNPIYLCRKFGSSTWEYLDRIELEKEVLGDYT